MAKMASGRKLVFDKEGVEAFALRFIEIRTKAGYTQQQLAFETGVPRIQIAKIESGKHNPTISTVFKIARGMNVPPEEFFKFTLF